MVDENNTPIEGVQWQMFWLHVGVAPWAAPTAIASGTTGANGIVQVDLVPSADMLTEVVNNDGFVNLSIFGTCWATQLLGQVCAPNPNPTMGAFWSTARSVYVNIANEREDAASSGVAMAERTPMQLLTSASAQQVAAQNCPSGWYWEDEEPRILTKLAEVHTDYGMRGNYKYGKTADSDVGVAVKVEGSSRPWAAGGEVHVGNKESASLSAAYSNASGSGPTMSVISGYLKFVKVRYQQLYGSGDERYCQTVHQTYADGWNKNAGLHRAEFYEYGSCPLDRAWGTCTDRAGTPGVFWQGNTIDASWSTTKESNFKFGGTACWFICVTAKSGHSTLSEITWTTTLSCAGGWRWYYDGVKDPHTTELVYADAGSADDGTQANSVKPLGC